jgi:F0F1-type ATP synthase delta subunit
MDTKEKLSEFNILQLREIKEIIKNQPTILDYVNKQDSVNKIHYIGKLLDHDINSSYPITQYNEEQLEIILECTKNNINHPFLHDPENSHEQMQEVAYGLESNIDVEIYAKKIFDADQMSEIRESLEDGLPKDQVNKYVDPQYDWAHMQFLRKALDSKDPHFEAYLNPKILVSSLEEIRDGFADGLDMSKYITEDYDDLQLIEIKEGLKSGIDVSIYDDPNKYNYQQMFEIRRGLEAKIDVSDYLDENFTAGQMCKIRRGKINGIDVSSYADPEINEFKMHSKFVELINDKQFPDKEKNNLLEEISASIESESTIKQL